jgi:hypothetical protein
MLDRRSRPEAPSVRLHHARTDIGASAPRFVSPDISRYKRLAEDMGLAEE